MEKKVTIVIPTFNRAKYVSATIDSALAQTVPCDIIVCDHGSSDNTPEVAAKYGDKIKYIRRERDFGPHFCWLEGVLNADTEFIHIHFDDDIMEPEFIEKTLPYMTDDVGFVFTNASSFSNETGEIIKECCFDFNEWWGTDIIKSSEVENILLKGLLMLSPAICLYRKKDFIDAVLPGHLPADFGGEYHGVGVDMFANLLMCLRYPHCACVNKTLVKFGTHRGSITIDACSDPVKFELIINAYNAYRKYYKLIKLYEKSKLLKGYINFIGLTFRQKVERAIKLFLKAIGLRKKEIKS